MTGVDNDREHFVKTMISLNDDHLRPGNHDLANLGLGNFQDAAQHLLLFRIEDAFSLLQ